MKSRTCAIFMSALLLAAHASLYADVERVERGNDGEVWYLLAMDEGHGFARKSNRDFFQAASVMFYRQLFEEGAE